MDAANLPVLLFGGVISLTVVMWFISAWNRLVRLEKDVERAWSNVDTLLQQRFDMIPNMVSIVKKYAAHEEGIFMELAKARNMFASASAAGDVKGVAAAETLLGGSLPQLLALSEAYPDLKANQNFMALQEDYKEIEDQVTDQRQLYNSSATNFNTAIETIPTNIVAGIKGCKEHDLYEAHISARGSVKINFDA
mgnify:FL=1